MRSFKIVHAADLHLDSAFSGLSRQSSPDLGPRLQEAPFVALKRLVQLCLDEKVEALLLAGDIYNQEDLSLRAQLELRDACEALNQAQIPVFLVHGNHDPLSSRLSTLHWPENVRVFGPSLETLPLPDREDPQGAPLALIQGISHTGPKESRNLAALFKRSAEACPQIGLLHASIGVEDGQALYAPAKLEDLQASGLDYWALGHVHHRQAPCSEPLAQYPGSLQGLHINERGPHGALLLNFKPASSGKASHWEIESEFRPLAPIGWEILELDLESLHQGRSGEENLPSLERRIRKSFEELPALTWPGCEGLVLRLRLKGRSALDSELRRRQIQLELMEALQAAQVGDLRIWIKDLEIQTKPLRNRELALERQDLLGEVLRRADLWREDPAQLIGMADEALGDLWRKANLRRVVGRLDNLELADLLDEAERICADLLERN